MAFIRFFNTGVPCYRDENSNEDYDKMVHRFNNGFNAFRDETPAANITEMEKQYNIAMALPGVSKSDIHIQQKKGFLTVSIDNNTDNKENNYSRREFDYAGTSRTFRTGDSIDAENITATYENGILTLHLPKKEEVQEQIQSISIE